MGAFERPGSRWGPVAGLLCPRMLKNTLEERDLTGTADPPRAHPASVFPFSGAVLVACMGLLVARPWWVRPALGEKFAFSSYLRKGCVLTIPEGFSRMSPRVARPGPPFCAQRLLSLVYRGPRLPAPSSRRDHAGQSFVDPPLCGALSGELFLVVGKGRAHTRVRGTPLTPRVAVGRGGWEGGGGLPVSPASRFPPVPSVACVPLSVASTSWPLPWRGRLPRVVRAVCPRACAVVASPPLPRQRSHGWWKSREPSSPPRGPGGSASRGVDLALGGRLFWGNGGWAASGASSDVGTRCRSRVFVGWHRCLHRSSRVGVFSGSRGGPLFPGRLGAAGVVGLLQGVVCSVIPAGSPRVPGRRPRALPAPCEAPSAGGRRGRSCRSTALVLPSRSPSPPAGGPYLPLASSGRSAAVLPDPPCIGGAAGHARAGGRRRGAWGKGPPGRREKLWFGGRPGPRGRGAASRVVSGGCVRGESCPARKRKEASGRCLRRLVGSVGRGAFGGLVRPRRPLGRRALGDCRGAKVGAWAVRRTRARVPVWRWGLRSMSIPSSPRGPASLRGLGPPRSSLAGSKVAGRPPPLLLRLSRDDAAPCSRWVRPLPPLLAGGWPPSGLPPVPVGVVPLPPVRGPPTPPGGVGGFPVSPTLRLALPCAWGGPLRLRLPASPAASAGAVVPGEVPACVASGERVLLAAVRRGGVVGFRRVAFPVPPPPSPARPSRAPSHHAPLPRLLRAPVRSTSWLFPMPTGGKKRGEERRGGGVGGQRRSGGVAVGAVLARLRVLLRARADGCRHPFVVGSGRSRLPFSPPARPRSSPCTALPPSLLSRSLSLSLFLFPAVPAGFARAPTWLILPVAYACLKD